ncbi:hypothetical protein GJ496_000794 [Pomphorhynchus laevis]|nr:hypothetical protein GJ496_000794 [Pomphorhynchus laevis]
MGISRCRYSLTGDRFIKYRQTKNKHAKQGFSVWTCLLFRKVIDVVDCVALPPILRLEKITDVLKKSSVNNKF